MEPCEHVLSTKMLFTTTKDDNKNSWSWEDNQFSMKQYTNTYKIVSMTIKNK